MKALVVIDVQRDFCAGGALAVPDGDAVVPVCNQLLAEYPLSILTADWHPAGHASFASSHDGLEPFSQHEGNVLWPDHCVQGTPGSSFHPDLQHKRARLVIRKGTNPQVDSYSAFFENDKTTPTGLAGALRELGVTSIDFAGLALDYCVAWSALDARRCGFEARILEHAVRGIAPETVAKAWAELQAAGVART